MIDINALKECLHVCKLVVLPLTYIEIDFLEYCKYILFCLLSTTIIFYFILFDMIYIYIYIAYIQIRII